MDILYEEQRKSFQQVQGLQSLDREPHRKEEQEGGLYRLKGRPEQALVHDSVETNELWHRRLAQVHYRHYHLQAKLLKVFQKYKQNMKEYARDVRKERTKRRHFQHGVFT